ncbi:MAG: type II secretion system F family protein [Gemmatimonadota bacterium]
MIGPLAAFGALDEGRHRAEFYRMWGAGYAAGLTHPDSLATMGARESPSTEEMRRWLLRGTERGRELASLTREGGARFEAFERTLLTLGEESGSLDEALRLLAEFYTRKHRLMLWVKKQMAYPVFTLLAACFVAPLPLLVIGHTGAYVLSALAGVTLLLLAAGTLIGAVAVHYGRKPPLARARMARALATAIQAGLPLPRAIRLAADASGQPAIAGFVERIGERRLAGGSIGASLAGCPHLTPEFMAVLATAEATGDFGPLMRLAELYEDGFR